MAKTKKELEVEREIKGLAKVIESKGIKVRREKLSRGSNFKVRSGNCIVVGDAHVFVDKRLSLEQQMNVLVDVIHQEKLSLDATDISILTDKSKSLLDKSLFAG